MYPQFILRMNAAIAIAATMPANMNLMRLYVDPFLNLSENIGISLTRRIARTTEAISMMYLSCRRPAIDMAP